MSKIKNELVPLATGVELNEKDLVNSLLTTLKGMVKSYAVALTEASNECLFKEYKKQFDTFAKLQRETFETLFRNGWYMLEEADGAKVGEKYNTLNKTFTELEDE